MIFQIAIVMNIVHETSFVVFRNKTELFVSHLLVCWDVNGVKVISVTVHVVHCHKRVVVCATSTFVNEAVMVSTLVV
ncbi:Uncharacterised protein [Chlamydia trachomatis]|nr:Uncharacterised protein [Chlamydia trachomatis]